MDRSERETHDFMNVESFSQLPFIRPAPAVKEKGIKLFGIEFGSGGADGAGPATAVTDESESVETNPSCDQDAANNNKDNSENGGDSGRRFECHYCCRNFPTSQALGGHQNAHKRERQHAKRAHLQSAMVHADAHHHHVYGLMNYHHHRLGSASLSSSPYINHPASWNTNNINVTGNSTSRYYASSHHASSFSHHHHQAAAPINGSPLAFWRIPNSSSSSNTPSFNQSNTASFNRGTGGDRVVHHPLPLFSVDDMKATSTAQIVGGSASQSRYIYESKPSVQDHVSLDLHL